MKINIRIISIILCAVFVVALVIFYMNYQKQVDARKLADQNLATAQQSLNKATVDKTDATKQLEAVNSQLDQLRNQLSQDKQNLADKQSALPDSMDNISFTDIIYATAKNYNVNIQYPLQQLSQASETDVTDGDVTFQTYPFSFSVIAGNTTDIVNFLHALATQDQFKNATIQTVDIGTQSKTTTTDNPDGSKTQNTTTYQTMDVTITMYTYNNGG